MTLRQARAAEPGNVEALDGGPGLAEGVTVAGLSRTIRIAATLGSGSPVPDVGIGRNPAGFARSRGAILHGDSCIELQLRGIARGAIANGAAVGSGVARGRCRGRAAHA
jgi:hypothetical protein